MTRKPNVIFTHRTIPLRLDPALTGEERIVLRAPASVETDKQVPPARENSNRLGTGWRVRTKPEGSMTRDAERDLRYQGHGEFWVGALAMAGTISASKLGVALYSQIVRLLN
jgi:hypothetical protein